VIPRALEPLPRFLDEIERALPAGKQLSRITPYHGSFKLSADSTRYVLCGYDWTYLDDPISVTYRINTNANQPCAGNSATQREKIMWAMEAWNNAGACFEFTYGGPSSCGLSYDGINCVYFAYDSPYPSYAVAVNTHWVEGNNMLESDILFNARDYTWWGGTGPCCGMDIWHVATHEFGHTLCLLDLYYASETDRTMYGFVDFCDTFARDLHVDDIAGIRAIYGECLDTGACCDGVTCTGDTHESECAFDWHRGQDCMFFRCPVPDCDTEGFETGDFGRFKWVHSGDAQWTIDGSDSQSGAFSARTGSIDHSQSSSLAVTLDCVAGEIAFSRKISSEPVYDSVRFYIDGAFQDSWSGHPEDWTLISYPVSAGTRSSARDGGRPTARRTIVDARTERSLYDTITERNSVTAVTSPDVWATDT